MNKKMAMIFLLIILSILLFSVTSLSAANCTDTNSTTITNKIDNIEKNTSIISKENTKNIKTATKIYVSPNGNDNKATGLNNNPYKTITKAITKSNNNDQIILNDGTYTISDDGKLNINKNISITSNNKNNVVIQAKSSVNDLFFINQGQTMTISNVQFKNINRCSVFANKGNLSLTNVNFISNSINRYGNNKKAIINNYGTLKINNCDFNKNTGYNGSAIYNVANTTITNSNLRNGNALFGGAVYSHLGKVIIRNTNITSNTVNGSQMSGWDSEDYVFTGGLGGAIYNRATMEIHNTTLQYNKVPEGQYHVQLGGCIINYGKLLMNNSKILNSYIMGSGVIYSSNNLNIINSIINNNIAEHYAGAIRNDGIATITNTTINRNQGFHSVITNNYQMQINNCIINTNNATRSMIMNNYNLKMTNVTGMFNRASTTSFVENWGRLTLISSKLTQNNGDFGGVIVNYGQYVLIDKCFINSNKANTSGGAIISSHSNITISNSQLNSNVAYYSGGAIDSGYSNLTIRNTTMDGNKVYPKNNEDQFDNSDGGALSIFGGTVKIIGSLINYNIADCGGGISIYNGTLLMNVTNLYGNYARVVGGAISTYYGENEYKPYMKLFKVNIKYNYADMGSHAISDEGLGYGATIDMTSTNINNNGKSVSAEYDNVLTLSGKVTMDNVQIKYNNASAIWSCANLNIKNSMISSNINKNGYMVGYFGKTIISNSRIRDNIAKNTFYTYIGQFIGTLSITNSTIYNPKVKYEICNDGELYQISKPNVSCENNWWGTQTKPTKLYNCKVTSYHKGLR